MPDNEPLPALRPTEEPQATISFSLNTIARQAGIPLTAHNATRIAKIILGSAYAGLAAYFGTPSLWSEYKKTRMRDEQSHALASQAEECYLCHRKRPTPAASAEPWRIFGLRGVPIAVCDRHFARPDAPEAEKMAFYGRVLRILEAAA